MIVDNALYIDGIRVGGTSDISEQVEVARSKNGFVWVGLSEPTKAEFDHIVGELNFHPLAVEDAVSAKQRPKIEDYEGLTFFVIKTVFYNELKSEITTGELMCFVDKHFIVIVRHGEGSPLSNVRHDIEQHPAQLALGPFAVLHAVIDRVIDGYTSIASELENDVIDIETKVFSGKRKTYSQDIYFLKREVIEYRHAIEPLMQPLQKLTSDSFTQLPEQIRPFFRDTFDHLQLACEHALSMDSLLTTVLQADLAHVQVRQNEDVRRISAWVALAAGPTMIAGIYGMNFENMPELTTRFGYFSILGVMAVLTIVLAYKFKKAHWL
ncbi:MAG: magnesium and cobalt transport protein CorA [Actinobacteria bacterium]|jgi:magnesium transporter|nr:magnesium and cobalt transport protein CorA [Actinomycetota bacterium]NBP21917.1 magnesium and cobalt transport protein CorA [Actinomycetota bacterium]NCU83479.1 magnesium and cobalt transport protein CorA [Actinomycetota bacterium]NCY11023.1 magnesium and cobalt transport protein CorA [Actinomycetota bacterium]NDC81480.1 magnesium and cobalt transport protein CorA [Actinomycetota bacterium]